MIKLPGQLATYSPIKRGWVQTNRSDIFGDIVSSFNMDLNSNLGKVRATKMLQTTSQNGIFGLAGNSSIQGVPVGFKVFNDNGTVRIFTATGVGGVGIVTGTTTAIPSSPFSSSFHGGSSAPQDLDSTLSDIEVFNGALYTTGNQKLYKNAGLGAWVNNALAGGGPWPMTVFAGRLYIANAGLGTICSTSDGTTIVNPTAQYAINLGNTSSRITFLRSSSNRIWIGRVNPFGKGDVIEWDGSSATITNTYRSESVGVLACVIKEDYPWIMDANGKLFQFSNGTFKEMARLPLNQKFLSNPTSTTNNRFIHPNGMSLVDGRINVLINNLQNDTAGSIFENIPSGVWEYIEETNTFYHKYSLSYTASGVSVYDYGQNRISSVGALSDMKNMSGGTTAASYTGTLLAGATIYSDATTTDVGAFTNDTYDTLTGSTTSVQKSMYFVTEKFSSDQIQDLWRKVFIKHKLFSDSGNSLVVKYRTTEADPTEITVTWVSTTSFTTTTNVSALVGYEVEVIQGSGSGAMAHILTVTGSGTYTVTFDRAITGVTGTSKVRLQNWIRVVMTATDLVQKSHEFPIAKASEWIQLKICCIFRDRDEIDEVVIINSTHQNAA